MQRIGANKCDCGKYMDAGEYYCVDCAIWDEVETQWLREDDDRWEMRGFEPSAYVHVKLAEEDE